MKPSTIRPEKGQGLVEYALILVLVAVVVIVILVLLGPTIGQVFNNILANLQSGGEITSVSAVRTGNGYGGDVVVTITVSTNTSVNVSDSQNASPVTNVACNGSCQVTLLGVGFNAGTVTVTTMTGATATGAYAAKN